MILQCCYFWFFSFLTRVWPSVQPHAVCDASPNSDGSIPFLPGIANYDWLRLSLHHWGMSTCYHPAYCPACHHNGDGDLHHWNLPSQGTTLEIWVNTLYFSCHCKGPFTQNMFFHSTALLIRFQWKLALDLHLFLTAKMHNLGEKTRILEFLRNS